MDIISHSLMGFLSMAAVGMETHSLSIKVGSKITCDLPSFDFKALLNLNFLTLFYNCGFFKCIPFITPSGLMFNDLQVRLIDSGYQMWGSQHPSTSESKGTP